MFGMFKEKLGGTAKRFAGKTDLLEATCAACALVAAADGEVEDSELAATQDALVNHPTLSASFKQSEIEATASKIFSRAKGAMGRVGLMKEIEQAKAKSTTDDLELILAVAIDVSRSDGEMEPQEFAVLQKVANTLGLNLKAFLDA
jgi:tellurite resistance protein